MRKHAAGSESGKHELNLVAAILGAAEQVGRDGKGRDGLVGYLATAAEAYPPEFLKLLAALLVLPPTKDAEPPKVYRTLEEIEAEMKRRGLPIPPKDWLS